PTLRRRPTGERRICSTTSCELMPIGFETSRIPSPAWPCTTLFGELGLRGRETRPELGCDFGPQEVDELFGRFRGGKPSCLAVPAPAFLPGDRAHVDRARSGAEADLANAVPPRPELLADEGRHDGSLDSPDVVDDPFREALVRPGLLVVLALYIGDRQEAAVKALDPREDPGEELDLSQRHVLVEAPKDAVYVHPEVEELSRHSMCAGGRVLVLEPPGVGHLCDIEGPVD